MTRHSATATEKGIATNPLSPVRVPGVVALAGLLLLAAGATQAAPFTCTTATGNGADTYVASGSSSDTNYGTYAFPYVRTAGGTSRKGYVRFDISGFTGNNATSATFSLNFYPYVAPSKVINVFGLIDSAPGQDWGETTITWNNAPANDKTSGTFMGGAYTGAGTGGVTTAAVFLGTLTITGQTKFTLSTPELLSFIKADTDHLVTFILTPVSLADQNVQYIAKEQGGGGAAYPTLTLVPEPASLVVLGLGALALLRRRRRDGLGQDGCNLE